MTSRKVTVERIDEETDETVTYTVSLVWSSAPDYPPQWVADQVQPEPPARFEADIISDAIEALGPLPDRWDDFDEDMAEEMDWRYRGRV